MEKIFDELERGWDAFTEHLPHAHYHHPDVSATPAVEAPVSWISEAKTVAHDLVDKLEGVDEAAAAKVEQLEGNPVVDSLLAAAHVPANALGIVVDVLNGLASIYPKPDAAPAEGDAAAQPAA